MSSTRSNYFSTTLFKKEIRTVLWLIILATIILFFTIPYGHIYYSNTIDDRIEYWNEYKLENPDKYVPTEQEIMESAANYLKNEIDRLSGMQGMVLIALPIFVAAIIMGSDRRNNSVELIMSMPYTRLQIIGNKIAAGVVACITPFLVTLVLSCALRLALPELSAIYSFSNLGWWFISSLLPLLLLLSLGFLVGSLVAPTLFIVLLAAAATGLPIGYGALILGNLDLFGINIPMNLMEVLAKTGFLLSPIYYVFYDLLGFGWLFKNLGSTPHILLMVLLSVIFIIATIWLFKRYRMEYNQELLLYNQLEPVYIVAIALAAALVIGPLTYVIFFENIVALIIGYALGGTFGWWISRFFIRRFRAS